MTCKKAKFWNWLINLTMIEVWEHCRVLCELDTKLLVFSNTLAKTMESINYLCYMTPDIHTTVTRLTSDIFSLN